MIANLHDVLKRVGPLDERTDPGTPRGLFHQFLDQHSDLRSIGLLLSQCQEQLGHQPAYARQDLIVKLGARLGFEPSYGDYEPARGRGDMGRWRSPGGSLILLDVRSERTPHDDANDLAQAIYRASAEAPPGTTSVTGLLVITPFYVSRGALEDWLAQQPRADLRCVSLDSLMWLGERRAAGQLSHEQIVRLLTTGLDADFSITLARRLTLGTVTRPPRTTRRPRLTREARPARGRRTWIARLLHDDSTTPRQLLTVVVQRRRVLGVSRFVGPPHVPVDGDDGAAARDNMPSAGERVAFYIAGEGIVGHATIDGLASNPASVIRGADRFAAVCRLRAVEIYDAPRFVDPVSRAGQVIYGATEQGAGAVMHALDQSDGSVGASVDVQHLRSLVS